MFGIVNAVKGHIFKSIMGDLTMAGIIIHTPSSSSGKRGIFRFNAAMIISEDQHAPGIIEAAIRYLCS
jgi:hypothetical protein